MTAFEESQTRVNLMRAFAGESQARNRYTFAASLAKENKLQVVAAAFTFTADQEKEHGELFYQFLAPLSGTNVIIQAGYPVDGEKNVAAQLRMAKHNEMEEYATVYPDFARVAREEGYARIADVFAGIAEIERTHAERFERFADALEAGTLFAAQEDTPWLCLNCGHIHYGKEAPKTCPICSHDQGYMIRQTAIPFVEK